MITHKLPNASATIITVTATATLLYSLIATAASAAHGLPNTLDEAEITPIDGDVRFMLDGNTPTGATGQKVVIGQTMTVKGVLAKMKLIRDSGESSNVTVAVRVGWQEY
ncbi:MAG: hypothetical protein ACOZBH_04530 [Patescibacteria group bacterium]